MAEANGTRDGDAIRVKRYIDLVSWDEDSTPPSKGWKPPFPYPYAATYPVTYFGPDGSRRDGGTVELRFPRPSAFEERLASGGAAEANATFAITSADIASAVFGEPSFRPLPTGEGETETDTKAA